ncbi:excinuclease ABC subunit UvrA [Alicyclobacillus fodiniaquatilis]|uniref:UvrABC system protein A n=1 Tax=Alicyclobacillus fodiniaquatilis TaxID=1661150 RepID=A0ABW4JI26_9BACL
MDFVRIQGAVLHNLKHINLDIPKGKFVVITGVSGSGKSTLAFDLLYREGRRRYEQAVGANSVEEKEGFESVTGLVPTVAVEQRIIRQSNPRSLVGTRTGILELMQIVFSLVGQYPCACGGMTDSRRICKACGQQVEPLPNAYFNFNSPLGMCLNCFGTGHVSIITVDRLSQGSRFQQESVWRVSPAKLREGLKRLGKAYGFDPAVSYFDLPSEVQQAYMHGDLTVGYEGLIPFLHRITAGGEGSETTVCLACQGARIGDEARAVTIGGLHISALAGKTLREQALYWNQVSGQLIEADPNISIVLKKIREKINNLHDVGLSHLSLYRKTPTLSGGELQRLFLASYLDSELEGLLYVFDEPTVGLHESEKMLLTKRLKDLLRLGNSVIVVEHDPGIILGADWIIEIGPGAGEEGGRIVYEGDVKGYLTCRGSRLAPFIREYANTKRYSSMDKSQKQKVTDVTPKLTLRHATTHNLKDVSVSIPLGVMVGVSGISGSGKSSLIASTLVPLLERFYNDSIDEQVDEDVSIDDSVDAELVGAEQLTGVSVITQLSIGRAKTSTPASYIGIWDRIRSLFAQQEHARDSGLTLGDFSFNSTGACAECKGEGVIRKETRGFVFTWPCHVCGGTRYRKEVLEISISGKNIADILAMSVSEAAKFFQHEPAIVGPLAILERVGMGYLRLGQSSTTISGGEAQRIKLAKAFGRTRSKGMLYILDEPTSGLSSADVIRLMSVLRSLVERGNTVLIIEHDLSVLKSSDWIIEMGPGGGDEGGEIIAAGTPEELISVPTSMVGSYWREDVVENATL